MKKMLVLTICLVLVLSICNVPQISIQAKATKKAMKFLKGTWVTAGQSNSVKIIFTRKYAKAYDLWNSNNTRVKSPKSKGRYLGKSKIVSTRKKGKEWNIKVKNGNGVTYYKGYGDGLICWFKEKGKWEMSASSSLERYSRKVYK